MKTTLLGVMFAAWLVGCSSADCTKCSQNVAAICQAATSQGRSCDGICANPPSNFVSACETMKHTCGCDDRGNNCACR